MLKQFQLKESRYDASELFKISSELTDSEKRLLVQGCVLPGFEFFESKLVRGFRYFNLPNPR